MNEVNGDGTERDLGRAGRRLFVGNKYEQCEQNVRIVSRVCSNVRVFVYFTIVRLHSATNTATHTHTQDILRAPLPTPATISRRSSLAHVAPRARAFAIKCAFNDVKRALLYGECVQAARRTRVPTTLAIVRHKCV